MSRTGAPHLLMLPAILLLLLSGPNTKTAVAILNCLLARQLCLEDVSCAAILEIIPRVCGPELVACSTVTVTKCQAALRTLQAFPFFKPTCLCREPHVDPECNSFRDFLFDHPCAFVLIKERDPYPVDSLPTCNHALSVCQQERKCMKLYEDFKLSCKVRDNRCRMDDRDLCHESWTNLRRSPMFGCICPNNHMKKRCDRIFNVVNHNPCVASENASASFDYGLGNSIVENPLVDAANGLDAHADYDHISVSVLKNIGKNVTHYPEDLDSILVTAQHQKNPSGSSEPSSAGGDASRLVFRSTCHLAMENCNSNYRCRMSLAPILHHCDISRCNRNSCMEALQSFYRKPEITWNVDIAFCLCKKTDDKQDTCLIAQEKLHPICAQKIEGSAQPTCLNLAEVCRESKECRTRLEHYEQSCAVDSVTKKCAGSPEECRKAMLGILGTDLRTSCVCKGTDMSQLYECLGWQRLLWVNPCVVESQKAFHAKLALEEAMKTTTTTTTTSRPRYHLPPVQLTMMTATEASLQTRNEERLPAPPPLVLTTVASTTMLTTTRMTTTTTTSTTTTTTEATTISPRYCVVQRPLFPDQYIKEGTLKRIYHEDECSDVCECENGEKLTCKTLCIDRMPCKTEFADYSHAAPAYQAYRGRCLCYSGKFICMKPPMGDYSLPQGVFLFLGYSQVDERELNKNQTRIIVHDVVKTLQEVVQREAVNGTLCSLELFNSTKENVIIMARLDSRAVDYAMLSPTESLAKEKEECIEYLDVITEKINNRHPDFASHLLLSIFKMAEVEIVQVETSSSSWRLDESKVLMVGALILSVFRMKLIS